MERHQDSKRKSKQAKSRQLRVVAYACIDSIVERKRQDDEEFRVSLVYILHWRISLGCTKTCLKNQTKQTNKNSEELLRWLSG